MAERNLWSCPKCARRFANRNQQHSCGRYTLEDHFRDASPSVRQLFDDFVAMLERFGPVTILPEKSRIAFQVRMSFAQLTVRRDWLTGHFVLARRAEDPLFSKIESLSPRNHVHHFRLDSLQQLDGPLAGYAGEAYAVGCQRHVGKGSTAGKRLRD